MHGLEIREKDGALRVRVHVKPRASRSRIVGERDGTLEVAVAAPPVDGEANAELVRTVARQLGVPRGAVTVVMGATGRTKLLAIAGIDEATLRARLGAG